MDKNLFTISVWFIQYEFGSTSLIKAADLHYILYDKMLQNF